MRVQQRNERDTLEAESECNVTGVLEDTAGHGSVASSVWAPPDGQPALSKANLLTLVGKKPWWKGWQCPRGSDSRKILHIKETLGGTSWHWTCKG